MAALATTTPWYAHPTWFRLLGDLGMGAPVQAVRLGHPEGAKLHLMWLSSGRAAGLSNFYSPLFDFDGAIPPSDALGLARCLRESGVRTLDLGPLDAEAATWREWGDAMRSAGYWVARYPRFGNWVLDVAGRSYAQYAAGLPGPLRTSLQRGRARLARAGVWTLQVLTEPGDALASGLAQYEAVYQRSWKPQETSPEFIRSVATWMAGRGELRLGVLSLNGEPLAAQIWFVQAGVASIFKLAYVQDSASFSPGTVLTAHLMAHVIDRDGVHLVDFLSGDDAYKRDWMSHRRVRVGMLAFDKFSATGCKAAARHWAGIWKQQALALWRARSETVG